MTLLFTENKRFSNTVKHEYEPSLGWCREVVTVNDDAADLIIGNVLGKVTADGTYKVSVETAIDGSEVPVAVVVEDVSVLQDTDKGVLAFVRGFAIVSKAGIFLDASFDDSTKVAFAYASLAAVNILANEAV